MERVVTSRVPRFVISALIAAAIVASPTPYVTAHGANPPRHPSNHLPRHHHRTPVVVKMRLALVAPARTSSRNSQEPSSRPAKRLPSSSIRLFTPAPSSDNAGFQRVFRPLRC